MAEVFKVLEMSIGVTLLQFPSVKDRPRSEVEVLPLIQRCRMRLTRYVLGQSRGSLGTP